MQFFFRRLRADGQLFVLGRRLTGEVNLHAILLGAQTRFSHVHKAFAFRSLVHHEVAVLILFPDAFLRIHARNVHLVGAVSVDGQRHLNAKQLAIPFAGHIRRFRERTHHHRQRQQQRQNQGSQPFHVPFLLVRGICPVYLRHVFSSRTPLSIAFILSLFP